MCKMPRKRPRPRIDIQIGPFLSLRTITSALGTARFFSILIGQCTHYPELHNSSPLICMHRVYPTMTCSILSFCISKLVQRIMRFCAGFKASEAKTGSRTRGTLVSSLNGCVAPDSCQQLGPREGQHGFRSRLCYSTPSPPH
jgi:hypothetical protein